MDSKQVFAEVQNVMRGVFNDDALVITRESSANTVDNWTSLNHINLIVALEQKFRVIFDLGEVEELKNVGELVDLILQRAK